jgi:M6 family metalloprotease-like protein
MRSRFLASCFLAAAVLLAVAPAAAEPVAPSLMPLDPEIVQAYRAQGLAVPENQVEARFVGRSGIHVNRVARPTTLPRADARALGTSGTAATEVRAIVLLVGFTDAPPGGPAVRFRPTVWDSMLFGDVYVRGGADTTTVRTLKRYYQTISYGAVDVVTLDLPGTVGWLTAPQAHSYYCDLDNGFGPYPNNVQRLVMDAVLAADPYVDFSQYASGGWVQNLFVVHAGSGAEWSGGDSLIWSHAWSVATDDGYGRTPPALHVDGVRIGDYSMEPEAGGNTTGENGGARIAPLLPTVGVYAHEFGHVLGLPDEYDYGYESSGTGQFSLMAGGSWNRVPNVHPDCAGNSPARPTAWALERLGFVTPTVVTEQVTGVTLPPVARNSAGSVLKVVYPGSGGDEYWLFENRQQMDFDQGFVRMGSAAHGMLVYHVDEQVMGRNYWRPNEAECVSGGVYRGQRNCDCDSLPANNSNGEKWYGISVEQADGLYQLERAAGSNAGDFFPGSTAKTSFGPATTPNTTSYYRYGGCTGFASATNIAEAGGDITLDLTADVRTHVLTVAVDGDGTVEADPVRTVYQHGGAVTLSAVPADGWTFTGWSGDTASMADPLTLAMYADRALTATFVQPTAVEDGAGRALALAAPRPSPMRGAVEIGFSLPRETKLRLAILDLQGREIAVLAEGVLPAGSHTARWDGGAVRGVAPAGLYFARLAAGGRVLSQRLVRLQ